MLFKIGDKNRMSFYWNIGQVQNIGQRNLVFFLTSRSIYQIIGHGDLILIRLITTNHARLKHQVWIGRLCNILKLYRKYIGYSFSGLSKINCYFFPKTNMVLVAFSCLSFHSLDKPSIIHNLAMVRNEIRFKIPN